MPDTYNDPNAPTGSGGPTKQDPYVPKDDEQTAVKRWLDRVKRAEDDPKRKLWFDQLDKLRGYVYGTKSQGDGTTLHTRTNLVFATIAAQIPKLYAKNPDIGVTPTPACSKEQLPAVKRFCTSAEAVLAQMFVKEARLKPRAKANIRSAMTTSYGVLKMVYQKSLQGDPLVIRRIQDTQENLAKVELLAKNIKEGDDVTQLAVQRDQLRAQLEGLRSGNEVRIFKGFVIDRVRSEDFLILDDSIAEFDEYVDAAALGHVVWMTVDDYEAKFGHKPTTATKYNTPFAKAEGQSTAEQGLGDMYVCVVEIWDKSSGAVRTVAKGSNRWCREPYAPQNTPQRWYPFYVLGFNLVEGRWRPLSEVELMMGLQDEYDDVRMDYAEARKDATPTRYFRKAGGLTEEDIKALSVSRRRRDWIGVEGSPTVPISQDVGQLEGIRIDPNVYDVTQVRSDIDTVVGMSDAARGTLTKPKTATEADIISQAMGSRVDEKRDVNEDLISDMAQAALEVALRDMTKQEVQQLAGEDAEWPEMTVDQIFTLVNVSVRAGSSGKPNADKEREQWTQLLPVIQKTMETVMALRESGHFDMADAAIELLRETLRRFQERLDIDAIIPPVEMGEDGKPTAQAQAFQQVQKLTQQVQGLQQQLGECQQELRKAQAGEASKAAQIQANADLKKDDIASRERIAVEEANVRAGAEKHLALLRAAVDLLGKEMDNAAAAQKAGADAEQAAQAGADAGAQMSELISRIGQTMDGLTAAIEKIGAATSTPAGA